MGLERRWIGVHLFILSAALTAALPTAGAAPFETRTARSTDGVPIEYVVGGSGDPTLVFVHGWTCDRDYWSAQLEHFGREHRVIAPDLAGHGASGGERDDYRMASFGADVAAAAEGDFPVLLIGHSMGATVMLEAARLMGDRVVGLVSVDALQSVGQTVPDAASIDARVAPLAADYPTVARSFIEGMFPEDADPELRERIVADMLDTDTEVSISAMRGLLAMDYASVFAAIDAPLVLINSTLWPTDMDSLVALHPPSRLETMTGVGHFPMIEKPAEFNAVLEGVIESLIEARR